MHPFTKKECKCNEGFSSQQELPLIFVGLFSVTDSGLLELGLLLADLTAKGLYDGIGRALETLVGALCKQLFSRNGQEDLCGLVFGGGVVQLEKDLTADDLVMKQGELVEFVLYETDQLVVCGEIDCTNLYLHVVGYLGDSTLWMSLLMNRFELCYRVVRVHLRGRQGGVAENLLNRVQICTVIQHVSGKGVSKHMGALLPHRCHS